MGAEVTHLTRNIKISGENDAENLFGGRIVVVKSDDGREHRRGWAQVSNVEFYKMGQFGHTRPDDLRAPIAFYHLGTQSNEDEKVTFVDNCAIHDSYNGGIVIGEGRV